MLQQCQSGFGGFGEGGKEKGGAEESDDRAAD